MERSIQTLKNLIIANLEDGKDFIESINRALRVMRFTIHTGLKFTPFELHHGRQPRTELPNIIKDGKTFLFCLTGRKCILQHRADQKYQFM